MSDQSDKEALDLLASLDAEFGKKPKGERGKGRASSVNKAPPGSSAKDQVDRLNYDDFESWERHREMLLANEYSKALDWRPSWIPEARLTYVIRQHCATCGNCVSFIGGEYVRFRSKRDRAVITRRAEVCSNLIHYGWGGVQLEDLVDEIDQDVERCPGCIKVEQKALELWDAIERKSEGKSDVQLEIEGL